MCLEGDFVQNECDDVDDDDDDDDDDGDDDDNSNVVQTKF